MAIVGCRYLRIEISRYRVSIYAHIDSVCVYEYVRYESHNFIDVKRICLSKKGGKVRAGPSSQPRIILFASRTQRGGWRQEILVRQAHHTAAVVSH